MYDKIIIGAGLYGLYSSLICGKRGENIIVIEKEDDSFLRATYINQARVHKGYHYPRSYSTAIKSANYFERFNKDFSYCINDSFEKIYATSTKFSWTNEKQFQKFCKDTNIPCEKINEKSYFQDGLVDGAFLTEEYTYDAKILLDGLKKEIRKYNNIKILYSTQVNEIKKEDRYYCIGTTKGVYKSNFVLNSTYAGVNEILNLAGFEKFDIKYELCEIIICKANDYLKDKGITVMDGPFFSIMPFGKTGLHSLTSVTFTPHQTSYDELPTFDCQKKSNGYCSPENLGNCNLCPMKPKSAWPLMEKLAKKYLCDKIDFKYKYSLFSMKPILKASEVDDSRPTVIKKFSSNPDFYSVLSGKINTIYDLEDILCKKK